MLLAIDTSTRVIGVALYDGSQVIGEFIWSSQDYHTVELAPVITDLLQRTAVGLESLQVVAAATGPGSYTGLRIGLAVAKGMALGRRLDLIGVPSLDILAAAQPLSELPLAAVLRAGRGRLAVSWYRADRRAWRLFGGPELLANQAFAARISEPTLVCGELTDEERLLLRRNRKNVILASPAHSVRRPSFLAELAWHRWEAGQRDDPATLAPIYLRQPQPATA